MSKTTTIFIRPTSYTTSGSGTFTSIPSMYDGDNETHGQAYKSYNISSTSVKSSSNSVILTFTLSSIPSDAVIDRIVFVCRGKYVRGPFDSDKYQVSFINEVGLYDADDSTTIGISSNFNSAISNLSRTIIDEEQIAKFMSSSSPSIRIRTLVSGRKRSAKYDTISVTNATDVFDTYIRITYTVPSVNIKVKQNGEWKNGTVRVKSKDNWVGAKGLFVKQDGEWIQVT